MDGLGPEVVRGQGEGYGGGGEGGHGGNEGLPGVVLVEIGRDRN